VPPSPGFGRGDFSPRWFPPRVFAPRGDPPQLGANPFSRAPLGKKVEGPKGLRLPGANRGPPRIIYQRKNPFGKKEGNLSPIMKREAFP